MNRYECQILAAKSHASEITAAFLALPRRPSYLAHSEAMFAGMLAHGDRLFPGLCWIAVKDDDAIAALLPLMPVREHSGPLRLRALYSPSRFDVLYLDAQIHPEVDFSAVLDAVFRSRLLEDGRCDVLRLRDLRSESHLRAGLESSGVAPSRTDGGASFLRTTPASPDMHQLSSRNLKSQIKRAERRLSEHGAVSMRVTSAHEPSALQMFIQLENAGYKSQLNSLVREEADRLVLTRALQTCSPHGRGWVAELFVGSELAASQICLQVDNTMYVLKVAFNEALRDASPGVLLMARFLEHCSADSTVERVDFCVRQSWHNRWHPQVDFSHGFTIPNNRTLLGKLLSVKRRGGWNLLRRRQPSADFV